MESIQEAERQLNQLNEIRNVVEARNDAANMASFARVSESKFYFYLSFFWKNIAILFHHRHWYHRLDLQDQGNKMMVIVLKRPEASLKNA